MPFFDLDPIDPDLELGDDIGPGRANRLDDRAKLASAIEKKTGAAPHAELGRFGETLAQRFAGRTGGQPGGQPGGHRGDALSPGFLGAVGAARIRRGTDPDTVVLKDGPTRDALKSKDGRGAGRPDTGGGFAPLPKIARPVGPPLSRRAPNRPEDARTLQGKLASLGYVPRVTETPLFHGSAAGRPSTPPFSPSGSGTVPDAAGGLHTLLDAVAAFQRARRLKQDRLVNPGGPTERALDAQNEKARTARLDRLETVSREIMDSGAPEYAAIADRNAADTLAGLVVAGEVQDQREERLRELKPLSVRPGRRKGTGSDNDGDSGGVAPAADRQESKDAESGRETGRRQNMRKPKSKGKILKTSAERRRSIIEDSEGRIVVEDNPSAEHRAPLHALHSMGQSRVQRYNRTIEAEARRQGVDPDLARAILYVENAQGVYGHVAEALGIAKSYFPMNIRAKEWAALGFEGKNHHRAPTNIRVAIKLLKRISERLSDPPVAKIATLYNSLYKDRVTDYGARVADVYRRKLWQTSLPAFGFGDSP